MKRFGLIIIAALAMTSCVSVPESKFTETGDQLTLETEAWRITFNAKNGSIRSIEDRSGNGALLRGTDDLWIIERRDADDVRSSDSTFTYSWDTKQRELLLTFDGPESVIRIVCKPTARGADWRSHVLIKKGEMLGWKFPAGLQFDVASMNEFIFPEHLGLALQKSFFEGDGAGLKRHSLGPSGLKRVTGDQCKMRDVKDGAVSLEPGKDAGTWLPEWYRREMARWQVQANRCPAGTLHDLSLAECENGSWLSAYRLGGWGLLFRFGGFLDDNNSRPQVASVIATLAMAFHMPPSAGKDVAIPDELAGKSPAQWKIKDRRIGIVTGPANGRPGTRRRSGTQSLLSELARQKWVRNSGMTVETITDSAALRVALAEPRQWYALVNVQRESILAESREKTESMLDAIRSYVRNGGIWWEAGGGYSFYSTLVPGNEVSIKSNNRSFCDFVALDSSAGKWTLYGVQEPDAIFAPRQSELVTTEQKDTLTGQYMHRFTVYGNSKAPVTLPLQRMVLGVSHRNVLKSYALDNQFKQGLTEKAGKDLAEALKRMILLKVSAKNLADGTKIAEQLPQPVIFHIANYLKGGFDKEYPDHLPPNPKVGTIEDLDKLIKTCRTKGHAFMPYTNPTWWCVNPKGPTFERVGDAGLTRGWDGNIYSESYGNHAAVQGHTTCAWHPVIRAANDVTREQFTKEHPVAVLFQDQVGARGHRWDTNKAAPDPGAYLEGIHRIAQVDSKSVPLGTEDGHDRLINYETMFCGLSFPWLPNSIRPSRVLYEDLWPIQSWRIEPLALFLAHDKVLFFHHDLGGFVQDRLDVSATLAMGFGLSWWTHSPAPSDTEQDWLARLCKLQAAIGPRCAGRNLTDFQYLAPRVIRSQWQELEIIANLSSKPWPIDEKTVIAPEGFMARSPDLEAGIFSKHGNVSGKNKVTWLIHEKTGKEWTEWTAEEEKQGR